MTIVLFFIILGSLVFVHELGHFLAAKKSGIRVDEFALGFPPKVLGKKVGETVYNLNLIPFGGYVKIFGDDADVMSDMAVSEADKARSFIAKPRYIQAVVLASGVLGNIVFAWLLISISFMAGIPSAIDGRYENEVRDTKLTITTVLPDSPAYKAGLRSGDAIVSITEGAKQFTDSDSEKAGDFIGASTGALAISYTRGKEEGRITVEPIAGIVEGKPAIGVSLDTIGVVRFGFFRSFFEGALMTSDLLREVTIGLFGFLQQAILGKADLASVTGPVGIAGMVGEARVLGIVYLLSFTAFISINLAVINLLPIPALDGGRLLFLAIEGIIRRPIPVKFTRVVNTTGFVLLILFMLFITYRDVIKLVSSS
ncbi:MAG: RIP metalloprotease RseP [bacterium]|nr:RIP metalloprotease RseP [bacterium]